MLLTPGTRAPLFSLRASDGGVVSNSDYVGKKPIVIFFYPRDHTLGCTVESCAFRDSYEEFVAAGAEVIGVSADSEASHRSFKATHRLPFILVCDADRQVARAFGVPVGPFGLPGRATFVIDKQGVVRDVFASRLRPKRHVTRALRVIRELAAEP